MDIGKMNISYVRIISEAGTSLDHRNKEGETPLIAEVDIKARKGDTRIIEESP